MESRWAVPEVKCSERIAKIRDHRIEDHDRSQIPLRDIIYREEFAKHPEEPAAMRFARGFSRFLEEKRNMIFWRVLRTAIPTTPLFR